MFLFGRHKTKKPHSLLERGGFLEYMGLFWMSNWSRRQESDLYPTLRRHVHYPLCYGETLRTMRRAYFMPRFIIQAPL